MSRYAFVSFIVSYSINILAVPKKGALANATMYVLGAVHKLRHPNWGYGGVSQKMTKNDRGVGGDLGKDDNDREGDNSRKTMLIEK